MKKISYSAIPAGEEPEVKTPGPASSTTEGGYRGVSMVEMVDSFDDSPREDELDKKNITDMSIDEDLISKLVAISDGLDQDGLETYANFSDFLIKKFAEAISLNPTSLFNQIIIKIKRADIPDTNEVIKKLTKIYSRTILLENIKNKDLNKSKESAYKKVLNRASQYLSES